MLIEIGTPASLPLGLVKINNNNGAKSCLLALTVQHPPIELLAEQDPSPLKIVGARAHIGSQHARAFLRFHKLRQRAQVEIERSIPAFVGLGADTMLGLTMAKALSWLNNLPLDTLAFANALGLRAQHAAEVWGFDRGGLLLVETDAPEGHFPQIVRRQEIEHNKKEAWAFVFVFPRVPKGKPDRYEADQLTTLLQAAPYLADESGHLVMQELWPAVQNDDIAAFGQNLMALQKMTQAAQVCAGTFKGFTPQEYSILYHMRDNGAFAWGRSLTGVALYSLVRGAKATIELRKTLRKHIGHFGGMVIATITDNRGASYVIKNKDLANKRLNPYRLK